MLTTKSPEFTLDHPLASAVAVLRAIFVAPRSFFLGFPESGPLREPIVFVVLITAVTATLRLALTLLFGSNDAVSAGTSALQALAFVTLSPAILAALAGAYWLSVRTFVGEAGTYPGVYRMLAYAYGAMVLYWVPVVQAFAFTYFALVLMVIAIRYTYRVSLMTAVITALAAYVPAAMAFIFLTFALTGLAFG
ncbi:MAG TPA: YIP1 family protein [Rubrobacteraceae bacterium]|nr:YIP1 family protein [Rubrobacteraceae bacterium]